MAAGKDVSRIRLLWSLPTFLVGLLGAAVLSRCLFKLRRHHRPQSPRARATAQDARALSLIGPY
jgi:hypothetical protein